MTTIDGRHINENERMRLLREEEAALGIQPLEYVSNEIVTARLSLHPPAPLPLVEAGASRKVAAQNDRRLSADGSMEDLAGSGAVA